MHSRGQGFDSLILHTKRLKKIFGGKPLKRKENKLAVRLAFVFEAKALNTERSSLTRLGRRKKLKE